jgi:pyruvate,water dikinase
MIDAQFFGAQPGIPAYEPHPDDPSPEATARIGATFQWALTTDGLPDVLADQDRVRALRDARPDFGAMEDHDLVHHAERCMQDHFRHLFGQHIFTTFVATVPAGIITDVCTAVGRPQDALKLMAGLGDVESAAPSTAMWNLGRIANASAEVTAAFDAGIDGLHRRLLDLGEPAAAFNEAFTTFLHAYGSRGPNEWESSCPTWETAPDLALAAIDRMRLSPDSAEPAGHNAELAADRERLAAEITAMLDGDPEVQGQFQAALGATRIFMPGRERTKTNCVVLVHEIRMAAHELGRRMVDRGVFEAADDYGMLTFAEMHAMIDDPSGWPETMVGRRQPYEAAAARQEPFVVVEAPPPADTWPDRDAVEYETLEAGESIQGMPGCPGISQGRARVLLDSFDPTALEPGDVLVAPLTDPSWTPLFVPASGVVVDVGAPLSHAIIVSRELGIPCVVSATAATRRIPDGALVEVNGETGTVTVLEG